LWGWWTKAPPARCSLPAEGGDACASRLIGPLNALTALTFGVQTATGSGFGGGLRLSVSALTQRSKQWVSRFTEKTTSLPMPAPDALLLLGAVDETLGETVGRHEKEHRPAQNEVESHTRKPHWKQQHVQNEKQLWRLPGFSLIGAVLRQDELLELRLRDERWEKLPYPIGYLLELLAEVN
jgi:hypothetical protein